MNSLIPRDSKQLGAVAVLTGTITPKGARAEAHVRLIRVQSGEAVVAASQDLGMTDAAQSTAGSTSSNGKTPNVKAGFSKQFQFGSEKTIREDWQIHAADDVWKIESGRLTFYVPRPATFPKPSIRLSQKLHGEVAVEIVGVATQSSEFVIDLCGERIVSKGNPFKTQILRQGRQLKVNNNGKFSVLQLKETWENQPTDLQIGWRVLSTVGGNGWLHGVAIRAAKAEKAEELFAK